MSIQKLKTKNFSTLFGLDLMWIIIIFLACQNIHKSTVISDQAFAWLKTETIKQLNSCVMIAHDGTHLYTPDGERGYAALWTRDFCYMVENAYDFIPQAHIQEAIVYLIDSQREDGCLPDRVQTDGLAVYCAGPTGSPVGLPPLDNSQFMVKLVAEYVIHSGDASFFRNVRDKLIAAMNYLPRSKNGLIYNDPKNPHSPYGFTDTIAKTGELLFSSLLYWEACLQLATMLEQNGDHLNAQDFISRASLIQKHLDNLWDEKIGMFVAASMDCRQVDIWGNAYAVYIGFHLASKKDRIIDYLAKHKNNYIYHGQIRHLPKPEYWEKTLIPVQPETYQNGAYWGTASGWVGYALWKKYPELSKQIFSDLISSYKNEGSFECINENYHKLDNYVASVTNPWGALNKILTQ